MKLLSVALWAVLIAGCGVPALGVAAELPDGRAYELVSPAEKSGNMAGVAGAGGPAYALVGTAGATAETPGAAGEEPSVIFGGSGPFGTNDSGVASLFIAQRTPTGWSTRAALPRPEGTPGQGDEAVDVQPAADLSSIAFTSLRSYGLGNPEGELPGSSDGLYLAGEDGSLQWLSKPLTLEPDPELGHLGGDLVIAGASPNLSTLYFTYYGTLLAEDLSRKRVLEENGGANVFDVDWGFYEWHEGALADAGELPNGSFSPYGAVPAATASNPGPAPEAYGNEVSTDGSHAFFVSPDPQACAALVGGCGAEQPELYVRVGGHGSLVSRSEVLAPVEGHPAPAPDGILASAEPQLPAGSDSYAFASPDGSRVFFASSDRLTSTATAGGEYEYDVESEALNYLPTVTGPVLGSSTDGSQFVFENTASSPAQLDLSTEGKITQMATVPAPAVTSTNEGGTLLIGPVRVVDDGGVVVFQTDAAVPGFNDAGGFEQIFRYDSAASALECVSCPPSPIAPSGDASLSSDDLPGVGAGHPVDSSGVSEDGQEVFFQSPDPLVPQDINGKLDVYEFQDGRLSLISSGTATGDSFFLDNSASGSDVFFTTTAGLVPEDTDGGYDVYDARVGGGFDRTQPAECVGFCGESSAPPELLGAGPSGSATYPAGENATSQTSGSTSPPRQQLKPKKGKAKKGKPKKGKVKKGKAKKHKKRARTGGLARRRG